MNHYGDATDGQPHTTGSESFTEIAKRLSDNLAAATLRLVDATQDFTSLIHNLVSAGQELERSLAIHREIGAASQQALEDARAAASQAASAAEEARSAQDETRGMRDKTTEEYGTVATIVSNLQQRIAALSVLGAPMPAPLAAVAADEKLENDTVDDTADKAADTHDSWSPEENDPSVLAEGDPAPSAGANGDVLAA